ncbi:5-demethoxyubiquinone hydroxylase, mitochondrial [Trichoplax sp. H2]|uniref:5-demethoxyubiquinone hydroxylase, mitochondrial n=1 Tax=Trichoplax adhaerens TaxID=10228 RepID=B3RUQ6_TRIAD|nr:hypothetical protein TRIADDRAFT_24662 [Trichoplax adhaerens]EDV25861.1 hypothetical protein TRIADDRAFT_24662 [Trichoplax adhaerens]RDD42904.1 5-demethoxyubiquinone hydroxylase, mitochondrial [Trichoplax sp. H2]|eukprot:XP_002111894.1 hypothetical protein TRIADDRAFT_24662 [Trichoplax adhaerens]
MAFRVTTRLLGKKSDYNKLIDRVLRVDHAGELGADRIYAGQLAVLGKTPVGPVIKKMWEQEKEHLQTFEKLIPDHRARPTALLPLWTVAGYVLGAGTAMLGKEAAMACTVAVEEVIGDHYNNQLRQLVAHGNADDSISNSDEHKELLSVIKRFRDEELEHLDTGMEHNATEAPLYDGLKQVIQGGCRIAIWLSERI